MINKEKNTGYYRFVGALIVIFSVFICSVIAFGQSKTEQIPANYYEFNEKSKYEISGASPSNGGTLLGTLSISGEFKRIQAGDIPQYDISKDNISISYSCNDEIINKNDDEWHICEDDLKVVDGIELEEKIKNGVIIVQTSLDKNKWITDTVVNNAFSTENTNKEPIYTTKDIQLVNGCFYRVIVAYELERITGSSKILFVTKENKEIKRIAEEYEFYAVNLSEKELSNAESTPRKELGEKICAKKDTGYSEQISIDNKNPHYGWDIGNFYINGYSGETTKDGNTYFLKNVGDKVTLWFKLDKDIENLDGNGKFSIIEDKNGYDQYFEIPQTNFKHGALIIRYTDHENVRHDPVVYTDFLAANATTGADTKAVLFEEGDYELALDYTIGEKAIFGSENDYRIYFTFSIRNGNTMFYPFDYLTHAELRDNAITPNGFIIDMAKSRYLEINVARTAIVEGTDRHTEDKREGKIAKDGDTFTEEGVYTVDVKNHYTDEHTIKTIYVGADPFMVAMAKSGKTVNELDDFLSQGYTIGTDGSLIAPPEPEPEPEETVVQDTEEPETVESDSIIEATESSVKNDEVKPEADVQEESSETENEEEPKTTSGIKGFVIVICVIIASLIVTIILKMKKGGSVLSGNKREDE